MQDYLADDCRSKVIKYKQNSAITVRIIIIGIILIRIIRIIINNKTDNWNQSDII